LVDCTDQFSILAQCIVDLLLHTFIFDKLRNAPELEFILKASEKLLHVALLPLFEHRLFLHELSGYIRQFVLPCEYL
jgi:hypothetical protein